jgi:hypothetical protein
MDVLDKRIIEPRIVQHEAKIWRFFEIIVTLVRTHHDTFVTFSLAIRVTLLKTCSCKRLVNTMRKSMEIFFFCARKGEGLNTVNKYALIFHTFTNQLRYLNRQVLIFKEMFENNDIVFFYVAPGNSRGNLNL